MRTTRGRHSIIKPPPRSRQSRIPPIWLDDWLGEMEQLQSLLSVRPKMRRGDPPWDNWSGRLRRHVYALVQRYKRERRLSIISGVVHASEREPLKINFKDNPFYWALYAARNDADVLDMTDQDLTRFATQLAYADRHNVAPDLLVGFVYQQGSQRELRRKFLAGDHEAWFIADRA